MAGLYLLRHLPRNQDRAPAPDRSRADETRRRQTGDMFAAIFAALRSPGYFIEVNISDRFRSSSPEL